MLVFYLPAYQHVRGHFVPQRAPKRSLLIVSEAPDQYFNLGPGKYRRVEEMGATFVKN
jgi:hypothetical protein